MLVDVFYLFLLASSTLFLQLIGLPLIIFLFPKKIQPAWWAWGRIGAWLGISLLIWFGSHLGLPLNTTLGFWLTVIFFIIVTYLNPRWQVINRVRSFVKQHKKSLLIQEFIFLFGFIFLGIVRTYHPAVLDLEKFMDAGFMQSYLRSPTFPIEDMWLAGETVNYYTFGHFMGSLMLRFWQLPIEVGFNVLLGFVMGLVLVESYALVQTFLFPFLKKAREQKLLFWGGLVAVLLIGFGGNSHPIWHLWQHQSFQGYWYPDATRFIENTIHEFPAYSFIVSDLHAHVWSLPLVLFTLFSIWQWFLVVLAARATTAKAIISSKTLLSASAIVGVLLGVLAMTSTWDMLIYGLFLSILSLGIIIVSPQKFLLLIFQALVVALTTMITMMPWWLFLDPVSQGVLAVTERSPWWQLLVLWGGHGLFTLLAIVGAAFFFRKTRQKSNKNLMIFFISLGITSLSLIILPELVYLKDIYPNHPRANTMFKLTFQAFLMMSLLIAWLAGFIWQLRTWLTKKIVVSLAGLMGVFLLAVLSYSLLGYRDYYHRFQKRVGLNGLVWLQNTASGEYSAILWLREQVVGRPVVLEAVGESYTSFARISSFSGLPTVLGWRVHEWLWRGGFDIPGERTEDVRIIYEDPLSPRARQLLARYKVAYIVVGTKEREQYQFNLKDVKTLGKVVFEQNGVLILER